MDNHKHIEIISDDKFQTNIQFTGNEEAPDYRTTLGMNIRFSRRASILADPQIGQALISQLMLYGQTHLINHHKILKENKEFFLQE